MEDSFNAAIVLLIIVVFNLILCTRFLLLKYTLTEDGLVYGAFTKKTLTYTQLKEISQTRPICIVNKLQTSEPVLHLSNKVKIQYWLFQGSDSFGQQLENKIGVKFERPEKPPAEKSKLLPVIFLIILGIILLLARNMA